MSILVTPDNFVWKKLNPSQAYKIFEHNIDELFILHEDNSDSLVETIEQLSEAVWNKETIVLAIGYQKPISK